MITETCYLLQQRVGIDAPAALLNKVSTSAIKVFDLAPGHCTRILSLMNQYQDLSMDLADASLVILAEHLGHGRILSVDQRDSEISIPTAGKILTHSKICCFSW